MLPRPRNQSDDDVRAFRRHWPHSLCGVSRSGLPTARSAQVRSCTCSTTSPLQAAAPSPRAPRCDRPARCLTSRKPTARPRRDVKANLIVIAIAVLVLGIGGVAVWRKSADAARASAGDASARRIAVLPFENLGDSSDAYFADGITDAVRGKLTGLSSMEVIARASSAQYRRTSKSPSDIARELGVRYLLTGT